MHSKYKQVYIRPYIHHKNLKRWGFVTKLKKDAVCMSSKLYWQQLPLFMTFSFSIFRGEGLSRLDEGTLTNLPQFFDECVNPTLWVHGLTKKWHVLNLACFPKNCGNSTHLIIERGTNLVANLHNSCSRKSLWTAKELTQAFEVRMTYTMLLIWHYNRSDLINWKHPVSAKIRKELQNRVR